MSERVVSLNGRIIRPIGEDFENTGILIVNSRRIARTNVISAYVKYFRLDINPNADFAHVNDNEFRCPAQYFYDNFELLEKEIVNGKEKSKWVKMG